jgi:hypothetical protein
MRRYFSQELTDNIGSQRPIRKLLVRKCVEKDCAGRKANDGCRTALHTANTAEAAAVTATTHRMLTTGLVATMTLTRKSRHSEPGNLRATILAEMMRFIVV